jgi:hypothetical protein
MRDPEGMRDLVAKAVVSLGLGELAAAGRLFRSWEEIVGPDVAARSQPLSLREGVLRIQTDSPAWAAEVRYLAPELLRRTNAALGREVARELKVSLKPSGREGSLGRTGTERRKSAAGPRGWRPDLPATPPDPGEPSVASPRGDAATGDGADRAKGRDRDWRPAVSPAGGPAWRRQRTPPPELPIRDGRLADAVARVLDAARANPRDNKGREGPQ